VIHGTVVGLQARMSVILRPPGRSDVEIEFVVDTGFEGFLTLAVVNELQLPYVARIDANLADDSSIATFAYRVIVVWNGIEREVIVLGIGRRPLIGTALLEDCHLGIDFCDGGTVLIDEIL
jgi:clan AA aspartic protease